VDIKIAAQRFYDYSLHMRGYSKATIRRYKYVITLYSRLAEIKEVADINIGNVRALFFQGRTERKWQTATFIVFYKSLSVFFKWCLQEGYLEINPINGIEKPKLEKKLPPKLTKQDASLILEVIENYPYKNKFLRYRNHAMFSLFLFGGLRLNELLNLRYTDVDITNLTLFINQGKGNKDRIIPINPLLAKSLEKYLQERMRTNKTCSTFFTSSTRNCGFTESGMKRLVLKIRDASGLRFTIHKLRHTFATLMLEGGCDIYSLSKMMGHSDIKTTTIYLAASAEHLRVQMTKHPLNNY
jgi:site-specific recombinase XerD